MNLEIIKNILQFSSDSKCDKIANSIIIYLRKSRKDNDYFNDIDSIEKTLERHERQLQEWAFNVLKVKIPDKNIYREVASGDTIDDRPVIREVLKVIESDSIKAVLCIEIERLARGNTIDQGIIAQAFKYSNTKIITPYKIYDLDNEDDLVYFEDGLYQSRKYLLYTKRVLKRGRIRSVQDGKYIGSIAPYGYKKKKLDNEKGFTLEFYDKEYKIVNLIANLYAYGIDSNYQIKKNDDIVSISKRYGTTKEKIIISNPNSSFKEKEIIKIKTDMGTGSIATYLNYLGIKPRKAHNWSQSSIKNILTSSTIYGYVSWGARSMITTIKNGEIIKKRPQNKNCIYVKGKFKPILDLQDERTKIIINKIKKQSTPKAPSTYKQKNPLSSLIICSNCCKNMIRRPCNNKSHTDTLYCKTFRCKTIGSNINLVEDRILKALKESLKSYNECITDYCELSQNCDYEANNLNSIINEEIKKINYKIEKCYNFLEDGTYTKDIFIKRIKKLEIELNNLEKRKLELSNYEFKKITRKNKKIPILELIINFYDKCNTIEEKNKLLSSIIDKVIYDKIKGGKGYEDKFNLKIVLKI